MSRPNALFPLFSELETLEGVGPKTAKRFGQLGVTVPRDLLFRLPHSIIDRGRVETIQGMDLPRVLTVKVKVHQHISPRSRNGAYRVIVSDAATRFELVFFHARGEYLKKILPEGAERVVSGKVELFDNVANMAHPDYVSAVAEAETIPKVEPVYPLTSGVTQKLMQKATASVLERVPAFDEWIDPELKKKEGWPDFQDALAIAHRPQGLRDCDSLSPARQRLAYDELFAHQMTLALARGHERRGRGQCTQSEGALQLALRACLGFAPTGAQERAFSEIREDMAAPRRMNRLLQGDVGAGKTLVAFMALLVAVEAGGQGAIMAPTEILARQHFASLEPWAEALGVRIELLTGRDKGARRQAKLEALRAGEIGVLIGTHALIQKDVFFSDLRLAIIDEQHRFGVHQRAELGQKGKGVDVLVMTATPIPRSLALAHYGDMDISVLDEKPAGRKPIRTAMVSLARIGEVIERLRAVIAQGQQCYWVCPLVEESEVSDLTAAEDRFSWLRAALGEDVVGLVHGQMPADQKDAAMRQFEQGETKLLVATTVIEVGVNVPNATIMVIERAERFGLAQLHQLRGRVGRGDAQSTCLLLYQPPLGHMSQARLGILRDTEDGFVIADKDMELRGYGDLIGTAQSGAPRFDVADLDRQQGLLKIAHQDARNLLASDPALRSARGEAARMLLWLMRKDEAVALIAVG